MDASFDPIFTNVAAYREIAAEALRESEAFFEAHRRPKGDGSGGHILSVDPDRQSFKQSLIAIAFTGMFIEAALWLYGCRKLGIDKYRPVDGKPLEKRLRDLGIDDKDLETKLKDYRETRKDLVHEKAVPLSLDRTPVRHAQKEAKKSVELMLQVETLLRSLGLPL